MDLEKERRDFESWAYSKKWNIYRFNGGDRHGWYVDEFVMGAWEGWVESKENTMKDFVLVPKGGGVVL